MANMGHSPEYILNAPVAAKKVLSKAGMTIDDIDLFEVNEAFAVVPMKFMRDLQVDHAKVNVNGGAIPRSSDRRDRLHVDRHGAR